MFGTSGIRGTFGDEITAELAVDLGRAVGSLEEVSRAVLGRDPRESGNLLLDAAAAGLRECGVDVVDLGLASTPTIARSIAWQDADVGISITASHNPAPDNGFKLWQPSGQAFDTAQRERVLEQLEAETYAGVDWQAVGARESWTKGPDRHVAALVETVSVSRPLDVVVDVGNGAGGLTAEALTRLGCSVTTLNAQPDGRFPGRESEPTAETLANLCAQVASTDADLGIAHDGDADRMMAVDETGRFVTGDELLALFGRMAVESGADEQIAAPLNTSLMVDDALADHEATVTRTSVGDVYVAEAATATNVVFGGEPSGAWIWPEETLCPDGPLAACKLVELVAAEGSLAAQLDTFERYPLERDSIETSEKAAVMTAVRSRVLEEYDDVQTMDGVRVETDAGWFLIRASGTQPLVRVTAEGRSEDACAQLFETAKGLVIDAIEE